MSQPLTLANLRQSFVNFLDEDNYFTQLVKLIEDKTKVNREYIAYGLIGFIALYLIVGFGNDFVCNLIGFGWPAYQSIKAIETVHTSEDDTKWLMYWVVYAMFGLLEFFGDHLLFWVPFYTLTKCVFLLWLMVPGQNGGTYVLYNKVVKPLFLKHESKIDKYVNQGKDAVKQAVNNNFAKND